MMGVVGGHGITARFDGDASLRKRPMRRILDPLVLMGAQVLEQAEGGRCPILLKGTPEPAPIEYRTPVASAQIKSAVLLAGLNALGRTTVIESEASRDHTEKMLRLFRRRIALRALWRAWPQDHAGRPAGTCAPADCRAGRSVFRRLPHRGGAAGQGFGYRRRGRDDESRCASAFSPRCWKWAREIDILDRREEGGEEVADLRVRASELTGVDVPAARAPAMIDEYLDPRRGRVPLRAA